MERSVFNQLHEYLLSNNLYPIFQSAYRACHSTETALLKVQKDLLLNMDRGHVTLLVLLGLSPAFDTIDHSILLSRLQYKVGFDVLVLSWFKSYLTRRLFKVLVNDVLSDTFDQEWGVPQGSCLGPLLFVLYFSKLFETTRGNSLLFGHPQYQIQKLQRVQNASARLIFSMPRYCHSTPLLLDLNWLPVNQRIPFKILLLVYKVLHQLAPCYLVDLISVMPSSSYNLRSNNNGVLLHHSPAYSKKTLDDCSFSRAVPKLWNNLPFEISVLNSVVSFKSQLKTFSFKKDFY